jgi:hypothetical protein
MPDDPPMEIDASSAPTTPADAAPRLNVVSSAGLRDWPARRRIELQSGRP